jgi:hypothetical protein
MNVFDPAIFAAGAPCIPCCTAECACALQLPSQDIDFWGASPFADYATAAARLANFTNGCIGYGKDSSSSPSPQGQPLAAFTATFDGTDLVLAGEGNLPDGPGVYMSSCITMAAGDLTFSFVLDNPGSVDAYVVDCSTGSFVFSDSSASSPIVATGLAEGTYVVVVILSSSSPSTDPGKGTVTITSSGVYVVNPVVALWDDSGTTRTLEACPKLYLPPLTETTGDWYADCAAAEDAMAEFGSDCLGYYEANTVSSNVAYTVAIGGGNFSTDVQVTIPNPGFAPVLTSYSALVLEAGEDLLIDYTIPSFDPGKTEDISATLYTESGAVVGTFSFTSSMGGGDTGTFTFSSLPYTGKYIIALYVMGYATDPGPGGEVTGFADVQWDGTSTGTLSGAELQALYDASLECPGRLKCGDTC